MARIITSFSLCWYEVFNMNMCYYCCKVNLIMLLCSLKFWKISNSTNPGEFWGIPSSTSTGGFSREFKVKNHHLAAQLMWKATNTKPKNRKLTSVNQCMRDQPVFPLGGTNPGGFWGIIQYNKSSWVFLGCGKEIVELHICLFFQNHFHWTWIWTFNSCFSLAKPHVGSVSEPRNLAKKLPSFSTTAIW